MRLLHRVIKQTTTPATDGVETIDLGVNPLSFLLLTIKPLNETGGSLFNYQDVFGLADALNRITVTHRGAAVFSMSGVDCMHLNHQRYGIIPGEASSEDTDNERRAFCLPIIFGRFPWDPRSCLPETIRGELTLELDIDIADTGYDGFAYTVESCELLGATPSEFERKTTISQTISATGVNDVRLPIGQRYRGVMAFGSVAWNGGTPAPTISRAKLIADGTEIGYSSIDWPAMHMLHQLHGRLPHTHGHFHRVDATSALTYEPSQPPNGAALTASNGRNHAFLELDPTRDDTFSIDTRGLADWILQFTADSTGTVRVIPIEKVSLGEVG